MDIIQYRSFQLKVVKFCQATMDGVKEVPRELLAYLDNWLTQHILHEDMAYKTFFEEMGVD